MQHLLFQKWKHQNNVWNLFRVQDKDTRRQWCSGVFIVNFEHIHFIHFSGVSIVDFEQINTCCLVHHRNVTLIFRWVHERSSEFSFNPVLVNVPIFGFLFFQGAYKMGTSMSETPLVRNVFIFSEYLVYLTIMKYYPL